MSISTWAATTGDWDDSKFSRAWNGPYISPAKGDLTSSLFAPGYGISHGFSVAKGDLTLTGSIPVLAEHLPDQPDKATLTFTAYSPIAGITYTYTVTASTLTLTGFAPVDGRGFVISPENASIEIIQTYNWSNYGGTWAASSDDWDVTPFIPDAVETGQNQPDAGSLTLTGIAPNRTIQKLWYVPSGSMTITGLVPILKKGHIITPASADLTGFGGGTIWADGSGDWASQSKVWGAGTLSPVAGVTYIFTIDSSGNLVFTPYEPEWPLVRDPKYISEIIIS